MTAAVAAVDRNYAIGNGGGMLAHLPGDLKMFRELTSGHTVIMGRKTFDALPCGALPDRKNVVISSRARGGCFHVNDEKGEYMLSDMDHVKDMLQSSTGEMLFIIGGGEIYRELLPYCQRIYLTHIDKVFDAADTWFPRIDRTPEWKETACGEWMKENGLRYRFCIYDRK